MASIRIGIKSEFNLVDSKVGIGTTNPTEAMDVRGQIYSDNSIGAGGISTVTNYQGFLDTKQTIKSSSEGTVVAGTLSGEIIIDGNVTVSSGTTYTSGLSELTATNKFTLPGITGSRPTEGTTRFNENLAALEFYTGTEWRAVNSYVDSGNRGRVLVGGGQIETPYDQVKTIDYIDISTQGNAVNFGDLTLGRRSMGAFASSTRAIWGGGRSQEPGWTESDVLDYVTIASAGNAIDFGNRIQVEYSMGGLSSSTRGLIFGGAPASDDIHYTTIATLGNETDFGSLIAGRRYPAGCASPTRGLMGGGHPDSKTSIEYITIASVGNAHTFGDLSVGRYGLVSFSSSTRGLFTAGSGGGGQNVDQVTIASEGNATDFGDLLVHRLYPMGASSQTRGLTMGGSDPASVYLSSMDATNIDSGGSSTAFGDLTQARYLGGGVSDSHGGLGGF